MLKITNILDIFFGFAKAESVPPVDPPQPPVDLPGVFPILTSYANVDGLTDTLAFDPTIRTQTESGALITRARFTSVKKKWTYSYRFLSETDKTRLENFQESVNVGSAIFNWTHVKTSIVYAVRLEKPFEFFVEPGFPNKWRAAVSLLQA